MNYYYIFGVIAIVYILNIFLNMDWQTLSLDYIGCLSKTSKSKKNQDAKDGRHHGTNQSRPTKESR